MQQLKRSFYYFDFYQLILITSISLLGLIFVWSSTYNIVQPFSLFFKKQCIGLLSGIALYGIFLCIDHRSWMRWGYFGYLGLLVLLLFTLIKGSVGMGAQRWINIGIIKFQPSELTKLCFPAFVAYCLQHTPTTNIRSFIPILAILGASFLLVAKQPDLGTALIILLSVLLLCWFAGLSRYFFIAIIASSIIAAPILWQLLKPYQKNRIAVFLGYGDVKKEAYQREQAIIAIGSGGITGKGLLQGTQNKLQFLPEGRTDFIFAVLCEEWGFIGAFLILILYILLFCRSLFIIKKIKSNTMQLFALGTIVHIIISTIINIAMVLGMLPIVGIPLPLMSYGITNLWITFASFGLFQNISMERIYRTD